MINFLASLPWDLTQKNNDLGYKVKTGSFTRKKRRNLSLPGNQSSVGLIIWKPFCCSTRFCPPSTRLRARVRRYSHPSAFMRASVLIWELISVRFFTGERTDCVAFVSIPFYKSIRDPKYLKTRIIQSELKECQNKCKKRSSEKSVSRLVGYRDKQSGGKCYLHFASFSTEFWMRTDESNEKQNERE